MHNFLAKDIDILENRIRDVVEKLKEVGEELRTVMTQSSETWHDNFGFENAQQQARVLEQRLDDLEQIRRNAIIIEPPRDSNAIAIGHTIITRDVDTGECRTFRLGSHIAFVENTVSYASPIGSLLLGKKIGDRIKHSTHAKELELEIIQII